MAEDLMYHPKIGWSLFLYVMHVSGLSPHL